MESRKFTDEMIRKLIVRDDLNHLLLSDVSELMNQMTVEFGHMIKIEKIGETWEKRPINMLVIDGRDSVAKQDERQSSYKWADKPAIVLTGAHHSRELVSI